jgi:hypothetical protein
MRNFRVKSVRLKGDDLNKKSTPLILLVTLAMTAILGAIAQPVFAQSTIGQDADQPLCTPGLNAFEQVNCLKAGPAQRLSDYEQMGLTFPAEAVPLTAVPLDLFNIPYAYASVTTDAVSLYATLDDAASGNRTGILPAGRIKYVSLSQKASNSKGTFYQIATGDWINGMNITKVSIPIFQGYMVKGTTNVPFGWILTNEAVSHTEPDMNAPVSDRTYTRLDPIHVYDTTTVNDTEWVMIGPDEWIEHRFVGIVYNRPIPPEGVTDNRWIEVNLYEQVLTVYDQGEMVFVTLISTGVEPFYTQPGTFQIYKKVEFEYMTGAFEADRSDYYYLEDVPYIMYFDQARALHGAYWNTFYGYQRSHGCVNLSVGDAHWLYDWSKEGDTVYVWDPSGKTPTDPSLYGAGGF